MSKKSFNFQWELYIFALIWLENYFQFIWNLQDLEKELWILINQYCLKFWDESLSPFYELFHFCWFYIFQSKPKEQKAYQWFIKFSYGICKIFNKWMTTVIQLWQIMPQNRNCLSAVDQPRNAVIQAPVSFGYKWKHTKLRESWLMFSND